MQHNLSENIRNNRKAMGLTQEQLAEAMGVTVGTVSKWENGNCVPDINMMMDIADFYNLSVDALIGHEITSKKVEDLLEEMYRLNKEHRMEELKELSDKVIVRYPYNLQVLRRAGLTYKILWFQNKNEAYRDKAFEIYNRCLSLVKGQDNKIEEIEICKEIALLEKNRDEAIEDLKKININGTYNDLIADILYEQGEKDESLILYDKMLYSSVMEISNVVGHMVDYFFKERKYAQGIELIEWAQNLILNMSEAKAVSYGIRWVALSGICKATYYALLGNDGQAKKSVEEAVKYAKLFDKEPVYDLYSGTKFVHVKTEELPVAWDIRELDTYTEIRKIVEETRDSKDYSFNKKEKQTIEKLLMYIK